MRPAAARLASRALIFLSVALLLGGCSEKKAATRSKPPEPVLVTVIGTNDLHGHIERLPLLAGYLGAVRKLRSESGGAVVLVDGGDMFQGTLESNSNEGAAVIEIYDALGYDAAAIGNHEFDFGPVGPRATPSEPGDDPQGALKARAKEAGFPLLSANILRAADGDRVNWEGAPASVIREKAGVKIGILGVTTEATPHTTIATNFAGLKVRPLADAIAAEAKRLRERGVDLVIVAAHAGGRCREFDDPRDLSSCDEDAEIFEVVRELSPSAVDLVVAGHSHAGVAHFAGETPVIEAYSKGRAFARADLTVIPGKGVQDVKLHPPRFLCEEAKELCQRGEYEGRAIAPDPEIAAIVRRYMKQAEKLRERSLGVSVESAVERAYGEESPLGNLFADLMREAHAQADVAITNGGGLRADLPDGELTYGRLYEALPFDNRFASIHLTAGQLRRLVASNLQGDHGILSVSGVRVRARCHEGELRVSLSRPGGRRLKDGETLHLITSDFLAHGGDRAISRLGLPEDAVKFHGGETIRDRIAEILEARGGTLSGDDPALFDPDERRLLYPGERPVTCR